MLVTGTPVDAARLRQALGRPCGAPDPAGRTDPARLHRAAVLVALLPGGVLLTRRADTLRCHAGQVAFPGGRIDAGDAGAEAACLREAEEEVGLDPGAVTLLGRLDDNVTGTGFCVTPVVGFIATAPLLRPSAAEVACVFVLPLDVLRDPGAPMRRCQVRDGVSHDGWVWPHAEQRIWGATAAILVELAAALARADALAEAD